MTKYHGSCHCGAVTYEVEMEIGPVIECNCSHCSRKGFLLAFVPASQFTLQTGEDKLTKYNFNKHLIDHMFCSVCGVQSFAHGKDQAGNLTAAINVRCLAGVDLAALERVPFNGKDY